MTHTDRPDDEVKAQPFWTRAQQLEKRPPCQIECPNSGDVRGWLGIIAQRDKHGLSLEQSYDKAWKKLVELNPFPAIIGRICPHPCESRCTRDEKDGAVSINAMERFLGDWGIDRRLGLSRLDGQRRWESVGVIGSGPAGLSFAYQMARRGYPVTIYEKRAQPGGMLRHAIPDYRLPSDVVEAEIQRVLDLGVSLESGVEPGKDISLVELRKRHKLLFLGMGAQGARPLGIEGESGPGVIAGITYLAQRKLGVESHLGSKVVVIGGGNTAIDAARSARRDGASVTVLYRRSRHEMPAAAHEVDDAISEGVHFTFLAGPCKVIRDELVVTDLEYQRMQLGEPDAQGRRRPVPVDGDMNRLSADAIIVAISQQPDWHGFSFTDEGHQWLLTEDDGKLADDLWAGGDDTGPGIASRAIAQGRLAAEAAHAQLRGEPRPASGSIQRKVDAGRVKTDYYNDQLRTDRPRQPQEEWLRQPNLEIDRTISSEQAHKEAERCFSCGLCFDCHQCVMYCNAIGFSLVENSAPGHYYTLDLAACEGCGKCIELCPCGYLEAREGSPWGTDV
jgi:NADPH-dependent glutamate synthase beta subunit-like oxidoreductase/ferredoxin